MMKLSANKHNHRSGAPNCLHCNTGHARTYAHTLLISFCRIRWKIMVQYIVSIYAFFDLFAKFYKIQNRWDHIFVNTENHITKLDAKFYLVLENI